MTPSDPQLHSTFLDLDPTTGTPLAMQIAFQANLVLDGDPAFPPLASLGSNRTVLPLLWAREGFEALDGGSQAMLKAALAVPAAAAYGGPLLCLLVAGVMLAAYAWRGGKEATGEVGDAAAAEVPLTVPETRLVTRASAVVIVYDKVPFDEEIK